MVLVANSCLLMLTEQQAKQMESRHIWPKMKIQPIQTFQWFSAKSSTLIHTVSLLLHSHSASSLEAAEETVELSLPSGPSQLEKREDVLLISRCLKWAEILYRFEICSKTHSNLHKAKLPWEELVGRQPWWSTLEDERFFLFNLIFQYRQNVINDKHFFSIAD